MSEVDCEYCGDSFDKRGLGAHQRYCDGAQEATVTPESAGVEATVRARDDEQCRRCGATSALGVHTVSPAVGQELANLVTLCAPCGAELDGLHPRTKRTKIQTNT